MDPYSPERLVKEAKIWWKQPYVWPLIAVTGATLYSIGVFVNRKEKIIAGGPNSETGPAIEPYGRKSADKAGLLEGDRAQQGIFPTKKIVHKLEGTLPATREGSPSIEREPENIHPTTPKTRPKKTE